MLDEAPKEGEGLKIRGSVMLASAESKEEVLEALKRDIYCTSGVWDWDRVQIHPVSLAAACRAYVPKADCYKFKTAFRKLL